LDRIVHWSSENDLELNPDKCVVMYFGLSNPRNRYHISQNALSIKSSYSDLGILVDDTLKFHLHANAVVSKTMKKAHLILKAFSKLDPNLFSLLFKVFLRPTLEYCVQVARPCYASFLSKLESCQRRLTKWCTTIRHLPYHERLHRLNLPTIEKRFNRGDMILVYQILNNLIDINPSNLFCFASSNTRGHASKLLGRVSNLNIRHRFFTERVVPLWNSLPLDVLPAITLNSFKAHLDVLL
jgi:hypothetical protein